MTKYPSKRDIVRAFKDGSLANDLADRFGGLDRSAMDKVATLCASLHNLGKVDLFRLANDEALLALADPAFFMAAHFLSSLLPELDGQLEDVMLFVDKLVTRGGSDGASNTPNGAFREWCKRDPHRSEAVIQAVRAGEALASKFLVFALEASADLATANQMALTNSGTTVRAAVAALGRIPLRDQAEIVERAKTLSKLLSRGPDDELRAEIIFAATNILAKKPQKGRKELQGVVIRAAKDGNIFTLHSAAQALWTASGSLDHATVTALLFALRRVSAENKGTLDVLDLGLSELVAKGFIDLANEYVTHLLSTSDDFSLDFFDSYMRAITGDESRLGAIAVQWLESGSQSLCAGLARFLQQDELRGRPVQIPKAAIPKNPVLQIFICRKALGWFFFLPTTAASVLVAFAREAKGDAKKEIQSMLFNPLLINYGGVVDYLLSTPANDPAYRMIKIALALHDEYVNGLKSVGAIPELSPPEHRRQIRNRRISEETKSLHKNARKQSVFSRIMRQSVLLHGRGVVSFVWDSDNSRRPVEFDLATLGVPMETPRTEVLDPIGLNFQLRLLRLERLKQ